MIESKMPARVYLDAPSYCDEAGIETQRLVNLLGFSRNDYVYMSDISRAIVIICYACGHLQKQQR